MTEPTFTCLGCGHKLTMDYNARTKNYCYLCDPNITLEECLSDDFRITNNSQSIDDENDEVKI